jgi:hypothetical protein
LKKIESIEQWNTLSERLKNNGWFLWQTQYGIDYPEGFHAWFAKAGKKDYEIVTYNNEVYKAIIKYKQK